MRTYQKILPFSMPGDPPPTVSWWSGDILLADRSFVVGKDGAILSSQEIGMRGISSLSYDESKKQPGYGFREGSGRPYVITELFVPSLNKDHAGINITCRAFNNNITRPLEKSITLSVYCELSSVDYSYCCYCYICMLFRIFYIEDESFIYVLLISDINLGQIFCMLSHIFLT